MVIEIHTVATAAQLQAFLELPRKLYAGNPYWVSPHPGSIRWRLDPRQNPFFTHGESCSFLATASGEVQGRITAVVDTNHTDPATGFFGFFETWDCPATAAALLETAAAWLNSRGKSRITGPFSLTGNEEAGVMVEGFSTCPPVGLGYNHPYYPRLLEGSGFTKLIDYLSYDWDCRRDPVEKLQRVAERTQDRNPTIGNFPLRHLRSEARMFQVLYSQSLAEIWGFSPLSLREAEAMLAGMVPFADPELLLYAVTAQGPAGLCLSLPDINPLRRNGESPRPDRREYHALERLRLAVLGVVPAVRRQGIEALLLNRTLDLARAKGYQRINLSLVREDNTMVNRMISRLVKATETARYRIYWKKI